MSVFVSSDLHLGHRKMLGTRNFSSVEEMDETILERWNRKIRSTDTVYLLGDVSFHKEPRASELLERLHGVLHLVKGNHDKMLSAKALERFSGVSYYKEVYGLLRRQPVIMHHYPHMTWKNAHHGSWMLHGHCHGSLVETKTTRLDVGIDTHKNLEPWSWEEILQRMEGRTYQVVDHHAPRPRLIEIDESGENNSDSRTQDVLQNLEEGFPGMRDRSPPLGKNPNSEEA